jgi:hypothetical protein
VRDWFDISLEPWLDRSLKCLEFLVVSVIAVTVICALVLAGLWVLLGIPANQNRRLADVVWRLNQDWKALLILSVPLFYRTIRMFLEQAEQIWIAKKSKSPVAGQPLNPTSIESEEP